MVIVFGGSFNPPTKGHLEIIKKLKTEFNPKKIVIVPVGDDYKKEKLISSHHRLEMTKILVSDLDYVNVSDVEMTNSYKGTINTLDKLSKNYDDLCFVIGADNVDTLDRWIRYEELLSKYKVIIFNRSNMILNIMEIEHRFKDIEHDFEFIDFDIAVSSSVVREKIEENKNMLTEDVYKYIVENNLYKGEQNV